MKNLAVTLKDIAFKAGISVSTVSLILNNKPTRISESTKSRVLNIAKELNYRPNQIARTLRNNRSKTIGIIVSDIQNSFYASIAKGLEDECNKFGWNLILCNTSDRFDREYEYIEILNSKGIDGIIIGMSSTGSYKKAKYSIDLLDKNNIPFVLLDRTLKTPTCNIVDVDSESGGYIATRHLLELGHTNIACVTGPTYLEGTYSRLNGYRKALVDYGCHFSPDLIYNGDYSYDSGVRAAKSLISKEISAIFAFNDLMAYGICHYLRSIDLFVPKDISVVGFDDIFYSKMTEVPLTTIRQPAYQIGQKAGNILIQIIEGISNGPQIYQFKPELIVRSSTSRFIAN